MHFRRGAHSVIQSIDFRIRAEVKIIKVSIVEQKAETQS